MNTQIFSIGYYKPDATIAYEWQSESAKAMAQVYANEGGSGSVATSLETGCAIATENVVAITGKAIQDCLAKARIAPQELQLIIHVSPILGNVLGDTTRIQEYVGATQAATYQVKGAAYGGLLLALIQAATWVQRGAYQRVLVSCLDNLSAEVEKAHIVSPVLPGDLATAMLFSQSDRPGGLVAFCHTILPAASMDLPIEYAIRNWPPEHKPWPKVPPVKSGQVGFLEKALQKHGYAAMQRALAMARLSIQDIRWFIPINTGPLVEIWREALGIPKKSCLDEFANSGHSTLGSIPYAMMQAEQAGKLSAGDYLLLHGVDSANKVMAAIWRW